MTYQEVLNYSIEITRRYGLNYYRATTFFPRQVREAVFLCYAWMRIPDEYVDAKESQHDKEQLLTTWIEDWNKTREGTRKERDIHWYMHEVFKTYKVPYSYGDSFLEAMSSDLRQSRYQTYADLEQYMYGSAVVVGFTMLCIFGLHDTRRFESAKAFGEAMQMTNFLRDIKEDYEILGRVYLPQDEMERFGITIDDIRVGNNSEPWKRCMQYQIARCRELYKNAWVGIEELPWKLKFPLRVAARKYEGILTEIEKADYDIWSRKHTVSRLQKNIITIKSIFI